MNIPEDGFNNYSLCFKLRATLSKADNE